MDHFLTDDLSLPGEPGHPLDRNAKRQSYMGVCKIPGSSKPHRRLDIKSFPYHLWSFALLYFTGSDHFNRSMRLWAKKLGWTLSDKGLMPAFRMAKTQDSSTDYTYQDDKVWTGDSLVCNSEQEIFEALGLVYVDPPYRTSDPNAMKVGGRAPAEGTEL